MTGLFLPDVSESAGATSEQALREHKARAYRAMVTMHAREFLELERFRRSGRLSPEDVHKVARDLDALGRPHPLDDTINEILARADALELEREARQIVLCWCGARIINGHHCENGHLQDRVRS